MSNKLLLFVPILLAISSCIRWGHESKFVRFDGYELVGDGNDNDSTFFIVSYRNKCESWLGAPYCRMVIKDTSGKIFGSGLYSQSEVIPDVAPKTNFSIKLYAENFQFTDEVGKVKFYLSWTNGKGKNSVRRHVEY